MNPHWDHVFMQLLAEKACYVENDTKRLTFGIWHTRIYGFRYKHRWHVVVRGGEMKAVHSVATLQIGLSQQRPFCQRAARLLVAFCALHDEGVKVLKQ